MVECWNIGEMTNPQNIKKRYEFKEVKLPPPIIPLFQYSILPNPERHNENY
jgi:hypothetical protein